MERIAFHLTIEDGQREAYREKHEDVSDDLVEAYSSASWMKMRLKQIGTP